MFGQSPKLAVSEEYIRSLVNEANGKMHSNWLRVQRFRDLLGQQAPQLSSAQLSAGKVRPEAAAAEAYPARLDQVPVVSPLGRAVQSKQGNAAHAAASRLQSAMQGDSTQHDVRSDADLMKPSLHRAPMAGATKPQHAGLKASVVKRLRALKRRQKAVMHRVAALEDTLPESKAADRAWCWQQMLLNGKVRS